MAQITSEQAIDHILSEQPMDIMRAIHCRKALKTIYQTRSIDGNVLSDGEILDIIYDFLYRIGVTDDG